MMGGLKTEVLGRTSFILSEGKAESTNCTPTSPKCALIERRSCRFGWQKTYLIRVSAFSSNKLQQYRPQISGKFLLVPHTTHTGTSRMIEVGLFCTDRTSSYFLCVRKKQSGFLQCSPNLCFAVMQFALQSPRPFLLSYVSSFQLRYASKHATHTVSTAAVV